MWIGQGGDVGIGTDAPKANLHISEVAQAPLLPMQIHPHS
jgi:hypothetical protein